MSLATGTRLGPYEVLSLLGVGGMGEVYRARDTKLGRDVALKILPEVFAADPDRLTRFQREAQVLASLNHSNIAHIYGLEESGGVRALVMELVEGEDLSQRIARGPIPLDDALPMARQIAEALEIAHEQGVIHRDLKPANIKLRPDGTVKVLDFGLAKAMDPPSSAPAAATLANSPTMMSPAATLAGVILGTAAYMSPEQARGKLVDKRADIWAFGCVLFEMLTGKKPFAGETLADTVAAIVKNEPDWQALPAGTPVSIRALIARCLRKDPSQRLHDIADGRLYIEELLTEPTSFTASVKPRSYSLERALWIAAVLALGAALFVVVRPAADSSSRDPITFPVFPPEKTAFAAAINTTLNVPSFALSPDGRALVFSAQAPGARPMLWLRTMDQVTARPLAGTEDAQDPMWSPDGRWIAFFAEWTLKKIPAAGGPIQVITRSLSDFRGGTWGLEDTILVGRGTEPILRVNTESGETTPVTTIDASRREGTHRNPHMLPGGHHFLYSIVGGQDGNGVYVGSLDGAIKKPLIRRSTSAVYAPPGYLLFVDGDTLLGQAFDANRLEISGQPFLVAEHAGLNTAFMSGVSAARTGTIAYAGVLAQNGSLTWIDRSGHSLGRASVSTGDYTDFRLSPDEKRLAASLVNPKTNAIEIWLTDLARNSTARLASGGLVTASALWSADGTQIVFRSNRNGLIEFYLKGTAGGGDERPLLFTEGYRTGRLSSLNLIPTDWSPDGRQVILSEPSPSSGNDLWLLPLEKSARPEKFIASPAEELHGNFSPDGRLVAYTSNESGKFEIYVETFPRSERKWLVSTAGGYEPRWRADAKEIYYLAEDRTLMTVSVDAGPSFGVPRALFQTRVPAGVTANRTHYVPSRDGQRFLVNVALDAPPSPITVLLNWRPVSKP